MERILLMSRLAWIRLTRSMLLLFLFISGFCLSVTAQNVTIMTDQDDYLPGEWVMISGTGWQNNDSVMLTLTHLDPLPDPLHSHDPWYVKPDSTGAIYDVWYVDTQELGTSFQLDALGVPTGYTATAYFTDAATKDGYPTGVPSISGGNTYCSGQTAASLSSAWGTTTCGNGSRIDIPITIKWYKNTVNSNSGGTEVQSTNTNAGTTSSSYSPPTSTAGTLYYYAVVSWAAGGNCAPAGSIRSGTQAVIVNAGPSIFSVTGGGSFCSGGAGVPIGLSGSETGVSYQLKIGTSNAGSPVVGDGSPVSFGNQAVAGTYTVVATLSTCSSNMTGNAVVTVNPAPSAPSGQGASICGEGIATLSASDGAGTTIDWYTDPTGGSPVGNGSTFTTPVLTSSKTYYAESRNTTTQCVSANRTPVTATVNAALEAPVITADFNSVCSGGSVPLTSSYSSGNQWYLNGNLISGATNQVYNATATGSYTVTASANGCTSSLSVPFNVTVYPRPTASLTGTKNICTGGSATLTISLTGTGPWSGTLSNGQGFSGDKSPITVDVTPSVTTTYTIASLTDLNCQSVSGDLSGSAVVTLKSIPTATMVINGNNPVCYNATTTIKFNSPEANKDVAVNVTYNINGGQDETVELKNGGNLVITTIPITADVTYNLLKVAYVDSPSCENVLSGGVTVKLETTPPIWTSLPGSLDRTLECSDAAGLASAQALVPAASDNCPGVLTPVKTSGLFIAGSLCPQSGTYTNTWTVTDAANNTSNVFTQVITIVDKTLPTFTRPQDITIYTDASCSYYAGVGKTGDVTDEADNCSIGLQATYSDKVQNGTCEGSKVITRTWSLVDNCGNKAADQVQTITVLDNIAPTFTRPPDVTIYTDANCTYDAGVDKAGDVTDEADNCSTGLEAIYTDVVTDGSCEGSKLITRTWHLADKCGNAADDQVQTITVKDNTAPSFTRPSDITIYTDANCSFDADVAVTGDVEDEADNCSTGLQATFTDVVANGSCQGSKIITRTWHLTDNCGNAAENQVQIITVMDNIAPTFTRPDDVTIYTDANCAYDAVPGKTGDVTDEADNCSTGLQATYSDKVENGICEGSKFITRTWSLVDNCGNKAADQVQTITVLDNIVPTFTKPADKTIYTDVNCSYNKSVENTGDVIDEKDNCSTGLQATYSDETVDGSCQGSKIITRTWSLVDNCGNHAQDQVQIITVLDNTAPVITVPANITVDFNPAVCGAVVNYNVSAADNCSGVLTPVMTAGLAGGAVFSIGSTTVTYSATDACGNTSTNSFKVTVNPLNVTPVLSVSPASQQYSDLERFKVVIASGASNGCDNAALSATFTVTNGTSHVMGTANFVKNSSDIEAVLDAALLDPAMAPGLKTVSVVINGKNTTTFVVGSPNTATLTVTQEDAFVTFTGTNLVATSSSTSSTATVALRATVQDITAAEPLNDGLPGDIRNAKVRFLNGSTPITGTGTDASGWMIPVLVNTGDLKTGTVSLDWLANIGSKTDEEFTVSIEVSGYYTRNNVADNTIITVYKPSGDFITGGGYIVPVKTLQAAGTYSPDPSLGLRTNFGFNVKYNKTGTNLQGNMNFIFRNLVGGVVHTYQIKANAMTSLGVDIYDKSALKAVFVSKANLADITNPLLPVSLGGNLKLQVNLTDKGEPGLNDMIGLSLWDGSTMLYSSNWDGKSTIQTTLKGGNLVVHSGFSLNPTLLSVNTINAEKGEFSVNAYPNPFTDHVTFDLMLKTDSRVRLEIYDINGAKISTLFDDAAIAYERYQFEYTPGETASGMLFYKLVVNDQIAFTGKLVHK